MKDCLNTLETIFLKDFSRPFLPGSSKAQGIGDDDEVSLLDKDDRKTNLLPSGPTSLTAQEGFQGLSQTRLLSQVSFLHGRLTEPDYVRHHRVANSDVAFKFAPDGNSGACIC